MSTAGADDFVSRISLVRQAEQSFTGRCHSGAPLRAFGGQIAAQALMAAGLTVTQPGRRVHSLHGYFLRPGDTREEITYDVEKPRDGGSFSTRFVRALQHGETIFMMTASFSSDDPGPEHQFQAPSVRGPAEGKELPFLVDHDILADLTAYDYPEDALVSLRVMDETEGDLLSVDGRYDRNSWVRVTQPLPDDPLVHACALTYLSDLTMVATAMAPHRTVSESLQLASIDHAMWFHTVDIRVDDWLLLTQDTPVARHGHGLARALFYAPDGTLVASVVQEGLMRTKRA